MKISFRKACGFHPVFYHKSTLSFRCDARAGDADDKGHIRGTGGGQTNNPPALADAPKANLMGIDIRPILQQFQPGQRITGKVIKTGFAPIAS